MRKTAQFTKSQRLIRRRLLQAGGAAMGVRPTLGTPRPLLEVNLFDFQGDLYGAHLSVAFLHKLRDEMKFSGLEALKAQIGRDVQAARAFFGR